MSTLSIGSFTTDGKHSVQPYGHDGDPRAGLTARKWSLSLLLTNAEWIALNNAYTAWRDVRILDEDTKKSGVVGTTILFTSDGFGTSWTAVPCWFIEAPNGEHVGPEYLLAKVGLVDAAQALQVILKEKEKEESNEDLPDLGTLTIGTTVLKLLQVPDTYEEPPQVGITASGKDWIQGPKVAIRRRSVVGTTDAVGWDGIKTWFENIVPTTPGTDIWYPASAPKTEAKNKVVEGVKIVEYTVTLEQRQIRG
jgi:hypothetical protein